MSGTLYVCGTPIGNLEDVTIRVLRILQEVDIIAAEDTRHSVKLLNYYEIKTPLTSYHEHNKKSKGPSLINKLKEGKDIALVSDAGMPGISDPGEDLIKLCYENDLPVTIVPGATAVITALVLSGLSTRSYCFEGFLPSGKKQKRDVLNRLKNELRTVVFYEAPHHLIGTLNDIYGVVGDREVAVVKELTKKHETVVRGKLSEIVEFYNNNEPKGEFVIVLDGANEDEINKEKILVIEETSIEDHYQGYIDNGMDSKDAMKQVARDRGIGKRDVYNVIKGNE